MVKGANAGDVEFVRLMLDEGVGADEKASYEDTALCKAASGGRMDVIELLLAGSVGGPAGAGGDDAADRGGARGTSGGCWRPART